MYVVKSFYEKCIFKINETFNETYLLIEYLNDLYILNRFLASISNVNRKF